MKWDGVTPSAALATIRDAAEQLSNPNFDQDDRDRLLETINQCVQDLNVLVRSAQTPDNSE